ncbi:DUF397 domain-containing protein [Marinitenerispora sediminis]|uniref:DUF397 domain-containing protein n=1 Tax=Marinitenerispora sediminis TaxID=1931232 RepID=A0A368T7R4_9ACTN|nr:DUF397 domain-containing protein [Marinitenerispora sediminis]RCV51118.1 DUF397 domain-containing protein [Marinitenerispora sediminis]RCV58333.1 DUF397 domain-containing protein [Marinitenerispora sediminis]RCV60137.1 DUF397 domain-containing protein [Marinitenerispora sediminis]
MAADQTESARWRTSSYSTSKGGQCVEVTDLGAGVAVRDSTAPGGVVLDFSPGAWTAFVGAVTRAGL